MGNQVITLENETNGMVSIGIPVSVLVFLCGNPVDNQITAVVPVKTTNNIEKGGFSGAAWPKNCHEFIVPKRQAYPIQCPLHQVSCSVFFVYVFNLKHLLLPFCPILVADKTDISGPL